MFRVKQLNFLLLLGVAKRDEMSMPMAHNFKDKRLPNLVYLAALTSIFIKWKDSGCSGLTNQTFLTYVQTMSAMPELAKYLQQKLRLQYVLPGKSTSDPIKSRFGWYYQANGGNFFYVN